MTGCSRIPVRQLASGLKWKESGPELPANGKELNNEKLSQELKSKVEFTENEWKQFGIKKLQMGHCIRSGNKYFQPAELDLTKLTGLDLAKLRAT
eukprot:755494-Prymnesium_polylepis.1